MIVPVTDKDPRRQFGELVQRARVGMELTHHDLADGCGVPQDTVKAWEDGTEVPRGREWARIKGVLRSLRAAGPVWQAALAVGREQLSIAEEMITAEAADNERREEEWFEHQPKRLDDEAAVDEPALPPEVPPLQDPRRQSTFGAALRIARLNIGFTQDELGQLLDVAGTTISTWETDANTPVLDNWNKLARALPELRDCTPPGVQNIRQPGRPGGPLYPRAQTNPGAPLPSILDRPVDNVLTSAERLTRIERDATLRMPVIVPALAPATMTQEIADAGVAYARALVDQRKAQLAIEQAKTTLNVATRQLSAADDRIKLAQATLVRLVDKLQGPS